jgi:hypothetical protein
MMKQIDPVKWFWLGAGCLALFLIPPQARVFGQLITKATVNGTVTDTSGAAIADSDVTLTNQATGVQTIIRTNVDGRYVAPDLEVGTYTVAVSKQGFDTFRITDILLHPTIVSTVNVKLTPGQVQTHIEVHASAAAVETSTPELSSEVSETQAESLPLNGRNFESFSALMPGVTNITPDTSLAQGGFLTSNVMSINGSGTAGAQYFVDGIWNENTGDMTQLTITPNPDTIQEVRVLQNNYGVQYSLNGAAVVLVETKSGTSTFHGSAFEYFRNKDLNARNFFSAAVSPLLYNIFGYTVGGPVYIPGHYNQNRQKTFFFWSEQWAEQDAAQTLIGASPTAAERAGMFSGALTNPATGMPFPESGGVTTIPVNAASLAILNATVPLPNSTPNGLNNYVNGIPQLVNQRDDEIKVDQMISERFRLTGEYIDSNQQVTYADDSNLGSPFPLIRTIRHTPNSLAELQFSQVWRPDMTNTTSVSMNRYITKMNDAIGPALLSQVPGYTQSLPYSGGISSAYLPRFTFSQGWSSFGVGPNVPQPGANDLEDTLSDNWSWLRGNHQIQAGVQLLFGTARQTETGFTQNGTWTFSGAFTGNAMADFLLGGEAATLQQYSNRPRYYYYYRIYSPYVQDNWKVTKRLTLTLGLRLQYEPAGHDQADYASIFNPATFNPAQAPIVTNSGTITPTASYNPTNGLLINGVNGTPLNFSGVHTYYWSPSVGFAWDPFGDGKTSLRGGYGVTHYSNMVSNGIQSDPTNPPFIQSITLTDPGYPDAVGGAAKPLGAPGLTSLDINNLQAPETQTYSLSLQRQLGGWIASVAGAGNIFRHLAASYNINQALPDPPYGFNPAISAGTVSSFVYAPYQGYGAINTISYGLNGYWNALEVSVRHPVGHDLFISGAYTWQHDMMEGNVSGSTIFNGGITFQNIYNRTDYGNTGANVPQILTMSGIWTMPWFRSAGGIKKAFLYGWQYSDITTIQDGFSLTPLLSTSTEGLATRPNTTGQPVAGPRTVAEWFNTAAFTAPTPGYFGTAGIGTIGGPGVVNFDMAFYKKFHITERHTLEFRAEIFNIFNHTNFNAVTTSVGSGNYGRVTSARDPRIVEFVGRYTF